MVRILLDTNMFIYLEDNVITNDKVLSLTKRLYDMDDYKIVIHPQTKKEINGIKNEKQKAIFKSKIEVYSEIDSPPIPSKEFHYMVGCKNRHDEIDNHLLFAVYRNCVSYLITNDKEIKKKSYHLDIDDKVLTIDEALLKFKTIEEPKVSNPPFISLKYLYELDIEDCFFDSLRSRYNEFDEWFKRKQNDGAKAYVTYNENKLGSFLMLKLEDENEKYNDFDIPFKPGKRLKISTMKVADQGKKIGESFIKIIVDTALIHEVDEIYVTIFSEQERLIELFKEYGFYYYGKKNSNFSNEKENIFVKNIKKKDNYYPFFSINNKRIFIVPIREEYHRLLFPENDHTSQLSIFDIVGMNTAGNSLLKAYLCSSNNKQIVPGSIILFYASGIKKAITCLGIVDAVFNKFNNFEEMYNLVKRRTVYSEEMLRRDFKADNLVILFKYYCSFDNYVSFEFLLKEQIINGNIQSIVEVKNKEKLKKIFEKANFKKDKYLI